MKKLTPKMEKLLEDLPSGWVHLYGIGNPASKLHPDLDFNGNTVTALYRRGLLDIKHSKDKNQLYVKKL